MALSDVSVRPVKATGADYTLADFDGLSLAVSIVRTKSRHFHYTWPGRQKRMSLGTCHETGSCEPRIRRDGARAPLAKDINPPPRVGIPVARALTAQWTPICGGPIRRHRVVRSGAAGWVLVSSTAGNGAACPTGTTVFCTCHGFSP